MEKISVVIITYNEARNIERCLASVKNIADEIILVDSHSTDGTVAIAESFGAKVYQKEFISYAEQKNFANEQTKNRFILSLDADEALSTDLSAAIILSMQNSSYQAYQLNRRTNYCGTWINYCGWYPDPKIRLFDKNFAKWGGPALHETLELNSQASLGFLKGDLLHYSFYSIQDHSNQTEKFSSIAAKDLFDQQKKPSLYNLYIKPINRFLTDYIFKRGFLDGKAGWTICIYSAKAMHLKYAKLQQLWNAAK